MKPGRWWRAQNACVDSPKLIMLGDKAFRNWFNLNCVANEHGGVLPALSVVAVKLRVSEARAAAAITELVAKRLFDKRDDGSYVPHDWNQWQYKTDETDVTNADRQKRHRAKMKKEREEFEALRNQLRNSPLRNGVTSVTAKRAEADKNITTTVSVERRGLVDEREGRSSIPVSSELVAINARFKQ